MLSTSSSFLMPFIVIFKSLLLGKRVTILIALIFVVVYFIPVLFIIFVLGSNEVINNIGGVSRINDTVESLNTDDLNTATAGRLVEASSKYQ